MDNNKQFNVFEEIARTVHTNTNKAINNALFGVGLTLGTYNGDSLKLDNFNQDITDFLMLDLLKSGYETQEADGHTHQFNTPIKPGDKVLVAEIGSDCVIIGRVSNG